MTSHRLTKTADEDTYLGMSRGTRRAVASVAALIGAGTAVTAMAAPADAAPAYTKVWHKVAQCESSGDWSIDTGNGYYGGVQFSSSTWSAYGGHKYASQASGASEREQIAVARRVLDAQGPDAWPVCGPRAGLTRSNGGATDAKLPASDKSIAAHAKAAKTAQAKAAKAKATKIKAAKAKAAKPTAAKATKPAPGKSGADTSAPARRPQPRPRPKPHARTQTDAHTYVVRAGDSLSAIVEKLHLGGTWKELAQLNHRTVSNPDVLHIGQVLHLPRSS